MGGRGPHLRQIWKVLEARAGLRHIYIYILLTASKSQPGVATAMKRLLAEVVDVSDDEDEPARQLPYMIVLGKFGSFVNASTSVT